jgi:hypothetical protein
LSDCSPQAGREPFHFQVPVWAREIYTSTRSFGSWSTDPETGAKSIGIGLRRSVGTALCIFGSASSVWGPIWVPDRRFLAGFLKVFRALLAQPSRREAVRTMPLRWFLPLEVGLLAAAPRRGGREAHFDRQKPTKRHRRDGLLFGTGAHLDFKNMVFGPAGHRRFLRGWAAPGTLPKGGGFRPPPFARFSGAPGAAQTPKMTDFRLFTNFGIL